jgi:dTDP-4-dehydrorhamnose reductase
MKVLILGANGLIGQQFVRVCQEKDINYVGTRYSRDVPGLLPFNLLDFNTLPKLLGQVSPSVVINSTGLAGGVNFCEATPEIGRKYHVDSTCIMVDWCKASKATYVYISTDYVFDGKNPPYREDDETNPLNLYGKLKLEGENYIRENLVNYVIARTTNVFGWDPETKTPNFLMNLIETLKDKDTVEVPGFLYGNPTLAGDLARSIMDLIYSHSFGLYHIVGPGYINRYQWAKRLVEMAGLVGKSIKKLEQPPQNMVPRPLLSHLDTSKFRNASSIKLHGINEGLAIFVKAMKNRD